MAKLNSTADGGVQGGMAALAATVCVAMCMIISLLGIKLWWFKHRLTFNHSATSNGAASSAQPSTSAAANTKSKSKDKRAAQEFNDPNEVRGVFRKRTEDDLDIVRPVTLPPVRIKNARSTPSLMLPPSGQHRQLGSSSNGASSSSSSSGTKPTIPPPAPPPPLQQQPQSQPQGTRQPPPTPPMSSSSRMAVAAAAVSEPPTRAAPAPPSTQSAPITLQPPPQPQPQPQPPTPMPDTQAMEPIHFETCTRKATQPEAVTPQSAIAAPTFDPTDPTTFDYPTYNLDGPQPPVRVQRSVSSSGKVDVRSIFTPTVVTTTEQQTIIVTPGGNSATATTTTTTTTTITAVSQSMETLAGDVADDDIVSPSDRLREQMTKLSQFNHSEAFPTNDAVDAEAAGAAANPVDGFNGLEDDRNRLPQQQQQQPGPRPNSHVEFQLREDPKDATKLKWTVQRPNSFVRNDEELWEYLERQASPISHEHPTWLELERDVRDNDDSPNDFSRTVEEEFNRIRHSYEINEADFLEINEELNKQKQHQQQQQPEGYGRNIDEDWMNFEKLNEEKQAQANANAIATTSSTAATISIEKVRNFNHGEMREVQTLTFSMPDEPVSMHYGDYDYDNDNNDDGDEDDDITYNEERPHHRHDGIIEMNYTRQVTFEGDEDDIPADMDIANCKRLKTRRPTGYAQRIINIEEITDDETDEENPKKETETTEPTIKTAAASAASSTEEVKQKPRLKVTFDTNTEEHYLPTPLTEDSDDTDDDDDDVGLGDTDSDERSAAQMPKPMERLTKTVYAAKLNSGQSNEDAAAMLFSSQVSVNEYDITVASDSWTAIRKHRYITEELRRYSAQLDEGDEDLMPPKDAPPPPPPPLPSTMPPVVAERHHIPPPMARQEL